MHHACRTNLRSGCCDRLAGACVTPALDPTARASAALPVDDPFSHSLAGAAWVPHEWLAELVLAAVYDAVGWNGLVLLTAAALALSLALLTRFLLAYAEPFSTVIAVTLGAALVLGHLLARPHLLAL